MDTSEMREYLRNEKNFLYFLRELLIIKLINQQEKNKLQINYKFHKEKLICKLINNYEKNLIKFMETVKLTSNLLINKFRKELINTLKSKGWKVFYELLICLCDLSILNSEEFQEFKDKYDKNPRMTVNRLLDILCKLPYCIVETFHYSFHGKYQQSWRDLINDVKYDKLRHGELIELSAIGKTVKLRLQDISTSIQLYNTNQKELFNKLSFLDYEHFFDIFKEDFGKILIRGESGMGKTCQMRYLVYGWCTNQWDHSNDYLLLTISVDNLEKKHDLYDIILKQNFNNINYMTKNILKTIFEDMKKEIILLIDGVDNFDINNTAINNLLHQSLYPVRLVIWSKNNESKEIANSCNSIFEIVGLNYKQIANLLKKCNCSESNVNKFIENLKLQKIHIKNLCKIPTLTLQIYSFYENNDYSIFNSFYYFYSNFLNFLLKDNHRKLMKVLNKYCFLSLLKNSNNLLIPNKKIRKCNLYLLNNKLIKIRDNNLHKKNKLVQFYHLSFQQFFASQYLMNRYKNKKKFINKNHGYLNKINLHNLFYILKFIYLKSSVNFKDIFNRLPHNLKKIFTNDNDKLMNILINNNLHKLELINIDDNVNLDKFLLLLKESQTIEIIKFYDININLDNFIKEILYYPGIIGQIEFRSYNDIQYNFNDIKFIKSIIQLSLTKESIIINFQKYEIMKKNSQIILKCNLNKKTEIEFCLLIKNNKKNLISLFNWENLENILSILNDSNYDFIFFLFLIFLHVSFVEFIRFEYISKNSIFYELLTVFLFGDNYEFIGERCLKQTLFFMLLKNVGNMKFCLKGILIPFCNLSLFDQPTVLMNLKLFKTIKYINLKGNSLGNNLWIVLDGLRYSKNSLRSIDFSSCNLKIFDKEYTKQTLRNFTNIETFYCNNNVVTEDAFFTILNGLAESRETLQHLQFNSCRISFKKNEHLIFLLSQFKHLESAHFSDNLCLKNHSWTILRGLSGSKDSLKSISFSSCNLSIDHEDEIENILNDFNAIQSIDFSSNELLQEDVWMILDGLKNAKNTLNRINFRKCNVSVTGEKSLIKILRNFTTVESICFAKNEELKSNIWIILEGLKNSDNTLKFIDFSQCNILVESITTKNVLNNFKAMESINFSSNKHLQSGSWIILDGLINSKDILKYINFNKCNVSINNEDNTNEILKNFTTITCISFECNKNLQNGAWIILNGLKNSCNKLKGINFNGCDIRISNKMDVKTILLNFNYIEHMNFGNNYFLEINTLVIQEGLKNSKNTLKHINFDECMLTFANDLVTHELFQSFPNITNISLKRNFTLKSKCWVILDGLSKSRHNLKCISFPQCHIDNTNESQVHRILDHFSEIENINFSNNSDIKFNPWIILDGLRNSRNTLRFINFTSCKVKLDNTDEIWKIFKYFNCIEYLIFTNNPDLMDDAWKILDGLKHLKNTLKYIDFTGCNINSFDKDYIEKILNNFTNIEYISLEFQFLLGNNIWHLINGLKYSKNTLKQLYIYENIINIHENNYFQFKNIIDSTIEFKKPYLEEELKLSYKKEEDELYFDEDNSNYDIESSLYCNANLNFHEFPYLKNIDLYDEKNLENKDIKFLEDGLINCKNTIRVIQINGCNLKNRDKNLIKNTLNNFNSIQHLKLSFNDVLKNDPFVIFSGLLNSKDTLQKISICNCDLKIYDEQFTRQVLNEFNQLEHFCYIKRDNE